VRLFRAKQILREWLNQQRHNRCWYYPDVFNRLAECLGVEATIGPDLPSLEEFRDGCRRYQDEQYRGDGQERSSSKASP
jgi:hypothetical protein